MEGAATFLEEDDILGAADPERLHEPPAVGELLGERFWHLRYAAATRMASKGACFGRPCVPSPTKT
jgi:hypothetical protein